MANIVIDDLAESRELDRHAMKTVFGGMARGLLFSMWPPSKRTNYPGAVYHFVTQFFVETFQVINQDITVKDSENVEITQAALNNNFSPDFLSVSP